MKLSKRTLLVLKNFAGINQSIVIEPGNVVSTISNTKDLYAKSEVEETFDHQVAIYDLNEFLNFIALVEDPDLKFTETGIEIASGNTHQFYSYADSSIITTPPANGVNLPSVEVSVTLDREQMDQVKKAASLIGSECISFVNGNIVVSSSLNSNNFVIEGVGDHECDYELSVGTDKLKMVPDDYDIKICSKGLASFEGRNSGITYAVALRPDGKYGS